MLSLGIEIKSSTCIMVLLESANLIKSELKIDLKNSYDSESVKHFYDGVKSWLDFQNPNLLLLKSVLKKVSLRAVQQLF